MRESRWLSDRLTPSGLAHTGDSHDTKLSEAPPPNSRFGCVIATVVRQPAVRQCSRKFPGVKQNTSPGRHLFRLRPRVARAPIRGLSRRSLGHRRPRRPRRSRRSTGSRVARAAPRACRADCVGAHGVSIPPNRAHPTTHATSAPPGNPVATPPRHEPSAAPDPHRGAARRLPGSARGPPPTRDRAFATGRDHAPWPARAAPPDRGGRLPLRRAPRGARDRRMGRAPSTGRRDRRADAPASDRPSAPPRSPRTSRRPPRRSPRTKRAAPSPAGRRGVRRLPWPKCAPTHRHSAGGSAG